MTNETFQKKIKTIISNADTSEYGVSAEILNLVNILKSDIAEAIKENAQSGSGVDFIDVPQAVDIIINGGIPTKRELIELAQEYMNDGDSEKANELLDKVLKAE